MWNASMYSRDVALVAVVLGLIAVACTAPERTTAAGVASLDAPTAAAEADNPNSAAGDDKVFIDGWLNGETVPMRYTRMYFCAEPPESATATGCVVGALATIAPRAGPIPKIYALAPAGIQPDASTVHCKGGTVCPNHPPTLDASRVGGPAGLAAPAHSHIITARQGGWHNTVNIRVTNLDVWNEIAAAKSLAKVRELQAAGRLGPDVPTNVYFFFEVHTP